MTPPRGMAPRGTPPAMSAPVETPAGAPATRLRALARLLDTAVRVPGTDVRVGLDPLLGLIPGVGDLASGALSAYVILLAWQAGAPTSVLLRMLGNVGVDAAVGTVPLLGDLFDVGFKANARNVSLLDRWMARPAEARRASRLAVTVVVALALLLAVGAVTVGVLVLRWVLGQL
jgi:hypothetical protein